MYSCPFICPVCGETLVLNEKTCLCKKGHCFDIAKEGYVNLTAGKAAHSGDNPDMVKARQRIMERGYYDKLISALISLLKNIPFDVFLDAGAGTGYIAGKIKEEFIKSTVIATDLSKAAVALGAKKNKGVCFAVTKSSGLPLPNGSADVIFSAFAPCFCEEFRRVLKKDGFFISVAPGVSHLLGLKRELYEKTELNDVPNAFLKGFVLEQEMLIKDNFKAEGSAITDLITMTPYYYRTERNAVLRLSELSKLETELEFILRVYKKSL